MNPDMAKAMLKAWMETSLFPLMKDKAKAVVAAADILGMLVGAAVGIAKRVGWTEADVHSVVTSVWTTPKD